MLEVLKSALPLIGLTVGAFILYRAYVFVNLLKHGKEMPSIFCVIDFMQSAIRAQLPNIPLLCPSDRFAIEDPWKKYKDAKADMIFSPTLTSDAPTYLIGSPELVHEICSKPNTFPKPTEIWRYQAINAFGVNIVSAAHGDEWKRHRGVVRACFGEAIFENVWDETINAFNLMVNSEHLEDGGIIPNAWRALERLTLIVIASAGFGMDMPWLSEETESEDMPFAEALQVVDDNITHSLLTPKWVFSLPNRHLQRVGRANRSLHRLIDEMAKEKRAQVLQAQVEKAASGEKVKPPKDLFGALVASQIDIESEHVRKEITGVETLVGLKPSEVAGNIFTFFVAGHETTAHTLTFTLAFLSVHPEVQEAVFKHINEVCPDGQPTYKDCSSLTLVLATCYESLRLRDMSIFLPKIAAEDTVLTYTKWDSKGNVEKVPHHIKKGSNIVIDTPAAQRNPFYWEDPLVFDPHRHMPGNDKIFCGFSLGQRRCIGQKYAETELTAFLSLLVRTFKFYPVPLHEGESQDAMLTRMLRASEGMTLTPKEFALRVERRK